jgi:hypothetical protein
MKSLLISLMISALMPYAVAHSEALKAVKGLGAIGVDGGLMESLPLGTINLGKHFPILLSHSVIVDLKGRARSEWVLNSLRAFLLPDNFDFIEVSIFDHKSSLFPRIADGSRSWVRSLTDSGMQMRRRGDGTYEVRLSDGVSFTFLNGELVTITNGSGARFSIESNGVNIKKISAEDGAEILHASYDQFGRCVQMDSCGSKTDFIYSQSGLLEELNNQGLAKGKIHMQYLNGLIEQYSLPDGEIHTFKWTKRPWRLKNISSISPVILREKDGVRYEFTFGRAVTILKSRSRDRTSVMEINRLTNAVHYQ